MTVDEGFVIALILGVLTTIGGILANWLKRPDNLRTGWIVACLGVVILVTAGVGLLAGSGPDDGKGGPETPATVAPPTETAAPPTETAAPPTEKAPTGSAAPSPRPSTPSAETKPSPKYVLVNLGTGKTLDVAKSGRAMQYQRRNSRHQQWWVTRYGNGWRLSNAGTRKCLDVPGSSHTSGTRLQLFNCNGTDAQRWTLEPSRPGSYALVSRESGLALRATSDAAVVQDDNDGSAETRWQLLALEPVDGERYIPFNVGSGLTLGDDASGKAIQSSWTAESSQWRIETDGGHVRLVETGNDRCLGAPEQGDAEEALRQAQCEDGAAELWTLESGMPGSFTVVSHVATSLVMQPFGDRRGDGVPIVLGERDNNDYERWQFAWVAP